MLPFFIVQFFSFHSVNMCDFMCNKCLLSYLHFGIHFVCSIETKYVAESVTSCMVQMYTRAIELCTRSSLEHVCRHIDSSFYLKNFCFRFQLSFTRCKLPCSV